VPIIVISTHDVSTEAPFERALSWQEQAARAQVSGCHAFCVVFPFPPSHDSCKVTASPYEKSIMTLESFQPNTAPAEPARERFMEELSGSGTRVLGADSSPKSDKNPVQLAYGAGGLWFLLLQDRNPHHTQDKPAADNNKSTSTPGRLAKPSHSCSAGEYEAIAHQLTEGKKGEAEQNLGQCTFDEVWRMQWLRQESGQSTPVTMKEMAASRASIFQKVEDNLGTDSQCHLDINPDVGSAEVIARPGQSCK